MHHDLLTVNDTVIVKISRRLSHTVGNVAAMLVSDFHYWLNTNSGVVIDGTRYVYNTYTALAEKMNCSRATIARAIKTLRDQDIILVGQFDRRKIIRTNYYTLNYKMLDELLGDENIYSKNGEISSPKSTAQRGQNETTYKSQNETTYKSQNETIRESHDENIHSLKMRPCIQRLPSNFLIQSEPVGRASAPKEIDPNMDQMDKTAKSAKSDTAEQQEPTKKPKVKNDTAQRMLELWNKFIHANNSEKYEQMTKDRARFLVAAFQRKFEGSMKKWEDFCEMISKSDFLMDRTKSSRRFLIQLDWGIKFSTIDRILNEEFGCKKPQKSQRTVEQEHYEDCAEFVEKEENLTIRTYKQRVLDFFNGQRRAGAFKAYFVDCTWFSDEQTGDIKLGVKSTFCASYIMEHFARDIKKILGKNLTCFVGA